ncbi:hypothetical protein CE841_004239 [Salmonella enterica]|nr:hypothetical protein [Salmonella enterica]ECE6505351.1 hypothetical protein [Salmonella enterica subsp. salamae]EDQ7941402.1 hypothetical protein [Salmonella enterica]EFO7115164.1 hypothetical protein [Salmonella enterica]EGT0216965.1 hypothetical protein [Salmonella enterica]
MLKTKQEWLFQLRKCTCQAALDKVIEKNTYELTDEELVTFYAAADHRLAERDELSLNRHVPART